MQEPFNNQMRSNSTQGETYCPERIQSERCLRGKNQIPGECIDENIWISLLCFSHQPPFVTSFEIEICSCVHVRSFTSISTAAESSFMILMELKKELKILPLLITTYFNFQDVK